MQPGQLSEMNSYPHVWLCLLSCAVAADTGRRLGGVPINQATIRTAVHAWLDDASAAEAIYGHISTWDTSGVTDMSYLFCWDPEKCSYDCLHILCHPAANLFDYDISAWDTSSVTTFHAMFERASAFNQDLSGWSVHNVREMTWMFEGPRPSTRTLAGAWATP